MGGAFGNFRPVLREGCESSTARACKEGGSVAERTALATGCGGFFFAVPVAAFPAPPVRGAKMASVVRVPYSSIRRLLAAAGCLVGVSCVTRSLLAQPASPPTSVPLAGRLARPPAATWDSLYAARDTLV